MSGNSIETQAASVEIPESIGRYLIRDEIGRGGMATVFRAYDPKFAREVAIKVLPRELLHESTFRARFEREARVIAALEHPAIVPVYDFGEEDGQPFFVMRLMPGGSLRERLDAGPLSLAEALQILTRLAPALDEAHARGIVHRDLKPGNILFDQHQSPFLSDFGLAKLSQDNIDLTQSAIVGTPAYISPEQAHGLEVDGRSDLYSLGAIFYEMLTCSAPYRAGSALALVLKHISEPVPKFAPLRPDLAPGYDDLIARAMAKDPAARFPTVSAFVEALKALPQEESPPPTEVLLEIRNKKDAETLSLSSLGAAPLTEAPPKEPSLVQVPEPPAPAPAPSPQPVAKRRWPWLFALLPLALVALYWKQDLLPPSLNPFPHLTGIYAKERAEALAAEGKWEEAARVAEEAGEQELAARYLNQGAEAKRNECLAAQKKGDIDHAIEACVSLEKIAKEKAKEISEEIRAVKKAFREAHTKAFEKAIKKPDQEGLALAQKELALLARYFGESDAEVVKLQKAYESTKELTTRFIVDTKAGTVTDTKTGLMWAAKDNGSNITWSDAQAYTTKYRGGGFTDWRLPTPAELEELYKSNATNYQGGNLIRLSECCVWSSKKSGTKAALLYFTKGTLDLYPRDQNIGTRALPVRRAQKKK